MVEGAISSCRGEIVPIKFTYFNGVKDIRQRSIPEIYFQTPMGKQHF